MQDRYGIARRQRCFCHALADGRQGGDIGSRIGMRGKPVAIQFEAGHFFKFQRSPGDAVYAEKIVKQRAKQR